MAELDKMGFNPPDGWNDTATFPNKQNETRNREMMNELPFQLRDFINSLIDQLQSVTETPGTDYIGAYKIEGLLNLDGSLAITAKQQLEALKRLVDTKSSSNNVYAKNDTYSKTETNTLLGNKADSEDVYKKTEIDSKVDMTRGAIASINGMANAKGNISVIPGPGIRIEVDDNTKTIRIISTGSGTGDMLKDVYDPDGDGIVDDSKKLGGKSVDSYYNLGVPDKTIPSDITKLSDITEYGVYTINEHNLQYYEDCPKDIINNSNGFVLVVHNSTNEARAFQELYVTNVVNSRYYRFNYNGVYGDFERIAYVSNISNPALNINPDFRINQRNGYLVPVGTTVYSDTSLTTVATTQDNTLPAIKESTSYYKVWHATDNRYYYVAPSDCKNGYVGSGVTRTFDGWKISSGKLVVFIDDDIITITNETDTTGYFSQKIETSLHGEVITTSCKLSDDTVISATGTVPKEKVTNSRTVCSIDFNSNKQRLYIEKYTDNNLGMTFRIEANSSFSFKYAKTERGSIATPLSPPKPSEALSECQRYQLMNGSNNTFLHGELYAINGNTLYFYVATPVTMRTKPTLVGTPNDTNGYGVFKAGAGILTGFTIAVLQNLSNGVRVTATKENHGITMGDGVYLAFNNAGLDSGL